MTKKIRTVTFPTTTPQTYQGEETPPSRASLSLKKAESTKDKCWTFCFSTKHKCLFGIFASFFFFFHIFFMFTKFKLYLPTIRPANNAGTFPLLSSPFSSITLAVGGVFSPLYFMLNSIFSSPRVCTQSWA